MLKKGESARRIACITEHEGFDSVVSEMYGYYKRLTLTMKRERERSKVSLETSIR